MVTSGREAALSRCEQPWHPSPSVLNSTQASQLNITRLLPCSPQYICVPSPPLPPQCPGTDIITMIIAVYRVDVYRTKPWSGVALFWFLCLPVRDFVMDVTRRPINCVLTSLLGRILEWTMSSKWDHTHCTLDLVQLNVLPSSLLCESLRF